jgi:hypothetical protein
MLRLNFIFLVLLTQLSCGQIGGGGASSFANKFTALGTNLTLDSVTTPAFLGSTSYYGRVLFKNSGLVYSGSFHFNLVKNDDSAGYFSGFFLDRLVLLAGMNSSVPIVTSSINLSVGPSYNATSNALLITNAERRYVGLNIDFGNNTGILTDVINAAAVFSSDFSTFVGGDNSTFFFIAQKATSLPAVTVADFNKAWAVIDFSVSGFGQLTLREFSKIAFSGIGSLGYNVFKGKNVFNGSLAYAGEMNITDSASGACGLSFDATPDGGDPIGGSGSVDGAFLVSPNKDFILGFDSRKNYYFAGSL